MGFMQQLPESLQETPEFQRGAHTIFASPLFQTVQVFL